VSYQVKIGQFGADKGYFFNLHWITPF
jgi:hypothetical protein